MKNKGLLKFALEVGPLGVFFLANSQYGIFTATATLMVATTVALGLSVYLLGRVPVMPLVTAACVLIFGGLTLYLQNELFMKVKPTVINLLFAGGLGVGLLFGRSFVKVIMGEVIQLHEDGWRLLTVRFTVFFVFLAVLNEFVWRNFDTATWVAFKSFGIMPITFLFMMSQLGLLQRYQLQQDTAHTAEK